MRSRAVFFVLPLCLAAISFRASAQEPERQARPESGGGIRSTQPIATDQDTSMLAGSGLNTKPWPIDRPVPGGVMRKIPGSRTWSFVKGLSDGEMRREYERYEQELMVKHGHEPRDIVIEVRDTTAVGKLRRFGIVVIQAPPCTVSFRVLYRQLPELKRDSLVFWGKGERRPVRDPNAKRVSHPPKTPPLSPSPTPTGKPTPAPTPSQPDEALSPQAVDVFFDGFETLAVPGPNWSAADLNSSSGADYWGDLSSTYARVRTGSWSAHCAAHGDAPFFQYDYSQDTYMQNPFYFNMSPYSTYDAYFWADYSTESGYDYFRWYYSIGGSWVAGWDLVTRPQGFSGGPSGWAQMGITVSNGTHQADNFGLQFRFFTDGFVNSGYGVYIDDILIRGTPSQPNLTWYAPGGWSYPIVPSSTTGTTTVGTLYAGQPTYIDWAILNNGSANAANTFYIDYYLDGFYIGSDTKFGLNANAAYTRTDWSYTVTTSGNHTLKMIIDPTNAIAESNESTADNTYERTFFWNPPVPPDLIVLRARA